MIDRKKYEPKRPEPEDDVGTIYCNEDKVSYLDSIERNDMFPYITPLPKARRTPEPPII